MTMAMVPGYYKANTEANGVCRIYVNGVYVGDVITTGVSYIYGPTECVSNAPVAKPKKKKEPFYRQFDTKKREFKHLR